MWQKAVSGSQVYFFNGLLQTVETRHILISKLSSDYLFSDFLTPVGLFSRLTQSHICDWFGLKIQLSAIGATWQSSVSHLNSVVLWNAEYVIFPIVSYFYPSFFINVFTGNAFTAEGFIVRQSPLVIPGNNRLTCEEVWDFRLALWRTLTVKPLNSTWWFNRNVFAYFAIIHAAIPSKIS